MKHFTDTQWADFVRNQVSPGTRRAIEQHIEDGCRRCQTALKLWRGVASIAREESACAPPDHVTRVIKSHRVPLKLTTVSPGVRLLFDSGLAAAAVGIRGSVSARQFLYETDQLIIDLRLAPRKDAAGMHLVGQVFDRTAKSEAQALPIVLTRGKTAVTRTATNLFGEFHFEFEAGQNLSVCIARSQESNIVLPLYG